MHFIRLCSIAVGVACLASSTFADEDIEMFPVEDGDEQMTDLDKNEEATEGFKPVMDALEKLTDGEFELDEDSDGVMSSVKEAFANLGMAEPNEGREEVGDDGVTYDVSGIAKEGEKPRPDQFSEEKIKFSVGEQRDQEEKERRKKEIQKDDVAIFAREKPEFDDMKSNANPEKYGQGVKLAETEVPEPTKPSLYQRIKSRVNGGVSAFVNKFKSKKDSE